MSLDLYIVVDTGGPEPARVEQPDLNITHNPKARWAVSR